MLIKTRICVFAFMLFFSAAALFAQIDLGFGVGPGKVGYFNDNNHPGVEEPYPVGPLAFRLAGDDIWVADSIGGKLIRMSKTAGFADEISVVASPSGVLIEDFALVRDVEGRLSEFWIIDAINNKLVNFAATGARLGEIATSSFVQPFRIEVSQHGTVYVADKGAQSIFIFDSEGNYLNQTNWEWSGFAVAGDETLYRLFFEADASNSFLVAQNLAGEITREIELALPEHLNPELWWVDEEKQEAVVTFTPATGFAGTFVLARIGFDGQVKAMVDLKPPYVMNRFIDRDKDEVWLGIADYQKAPVGNFTLAPFRMP
jgi:hypothetical protein